MVFLQGDRAGCHRDVASCEGSSNTHENLQILNNDRNIIIDCSVVKPVIKIAMKHLTC